MKRKRQYILFLERSIEAMKSALDRFNSTRDLYALEASLILFTNAWELLAKALLIRSRSKIETKRGTISAENAVHKLVIKHLLSETQADHIQQVISLRHACSHGILPEIPREIVFHLGFYTAKFFKDVLERGFPRYKDKISGNYLAISFDTLTTYADKVQKLISRVRRRDTPEHYLIWLLERGIKFNGGQYISQDKLEQEIKQLRDKKILPHLAVGKFIKNAEMVVVVPVQAPRGYTVDVMLRKGTTKMGSALPVMIKKTDIETDYPYLTSELAAKLNKPTQFTARTIKNLGLKGQTEFHQEIRSSRSGRINRYSEKALQKLHEFLDNNPSYSPYKTKMKK